MNTAYKNIHSAVGAVPGHTQNEPLTLAAASEPWSRGEFVDRLRGVGQWAYHDKHPFHVLMNDGQLSRWQIQLWTANRFYYQKNIPVKDAILLSRCPVREVRRRWVQRILDHDGYGDQPGGIERWLRLGESVGLGRDDLEHDRLLLPRVREAVDRYVRFVQTRTWVEAVAASLTELFAPSLMVTRLAAFEQHYPWVDHEGLQYFRSRLTQAPRDSEHGLEIVLDYCRTADEQNAAVAALQFKCELLWDMLDAIHEGPVEGERQQIE